MLPILLLTAWLTVTVLFMAICRMAARGDEQPAPDAGVTGHTLDAGLVAWEESAPARPLARHSHRSHKLTFRGVRTHGVR